MARDDFFHLRCFGNEKLLTELLPTVAIPESSSSVGVLYHCRLTFLVCSPSLYCAVLVIISGPITFCCLFDKAFVGDFCFGTRLVKVPYRALHTCPNSI